MKEAYVDTDDVANKTCHHGRSQGWCNGATALGKRNFAPGGE